MKHESGDGGLPACRTLSSLSSREEPLTCPNVIKGRRRKEKNTYSEAPTEPVLLQIESVNMKSPDGVIEVGVNFWDSGSTVSLITYSHAARLGLDGVSCVLHVQPAGHKVEK